MTAPVGLVTMPTTLGRYGSGRLRSSAKSPSAAKRRFLSSSWAISAPRPAGSSASMTIWYFDEPGKEEILPVAMTSMPSSGLILRRFQLPRQTTASIFALSSLSEK